MTANSFTLERGTAPLLVSVPHSGKTLPVWLQKRLVARALNVEDTDWHLENIYRFVLDQGASLIAPRYSRFLIDLNRPPDNQPMYAGANNTELCPTRFFTGDPIYKDGEAPEADEIQSRLDQYWWPYHQALAQELARIKSIHGYAILFDAHSIKSQLPWLFDGQLPDLNLGTANGTSCAADLRRNLDACLAAQPHFSYVVDGRFKGGYITRSFGQPAAAVHAVQLEMCWRCYMGEEAPYQLAPERVASLQPVLISLINTMLDWRPNGSSDHSTSARGE
jgi:N-formylglutamate deformylase